MDAMLRKALRKYHGLRQQIDNVLLGEDGDEWEVQLRNCLAKRPCWVEKGRQKAKKPLLPLDFVTITLVEDHNPAEFFQIRSGLWASDDFRVRRVVAKAKPSKAGIIFKLNRATLAKNLTDREIEPALPKNYLFTETQVCAVVACLIAKQMEGQKGTLLSNGDVNLFYTAYCVVYVRWDADHRVWDVSAWSRNVNLWGVGSQIFFPATDN